MMSALQAGAIDHGSSVRPLELALDVALGHIAGYRERGSAVTHEYVVGVEGRSDQQDQSSDTERGG